MWRLVALGALGLLAACSAEPALGDLPAGQASASEAAGGPFYYAVRPDLRLCLWPACGGFWVRRLNTATTPCAGAAEREECYVAKLDLHGLVVSATDDQRLEQEIGRGRALVLGLIRVSSDPVHGVINELVAKAAWIPATPSQPQRPDPTQ